MNNTLENCPFTLNTTRICSDNAIDTSIGVSRIGFSNMKPNAVILVNKNEIFDGIAATSLIHFPINASLLFTNGKSLNKETLTEIKRLSPKGYKGIHVILVGNISGNIALELNEHGFRTHQIAGHNHYETACMIYKARKEFENILIMSGEDYSEGIVSGYWSAHNGDPILFVQRDRIPQCAIEVIKKMSDINIYIIGSTKTVSRSVEKYLSQLDNVNHLDRIDGDNPYEIAVNFAKYKDPKTEFGWGRNYREGHAFTFGELDNPMDIIAGVIFAHMGKHTPLILIGKDGMPKVVETYIKSVKPMIPKDMPRPPFMHGFILGSTHNISYNTQKMIEDMISIDHGMMGMENMNEMMDVKDNMTGMHDEIMEMGNDMNGMISMHHQMMSIDDEDTTKDLYHMHEDNNEKNNCKCKYKMSRDNRSEVGNVNYKVVSMDEMLK